MGLDMWMTAYVSGYEEDSVYWRKSNEVFNFFDKKINGGVSNCVEYKIDRDVIEELIDKCNEVLENPELADEILPTTVGCFFGSTDYDDLYFRDVERTAEELEELLKIEGVFVFHAWW